MSGAVATPKAKAPPPPAGVVAWLAGTDHKVTAVRLATVSFVFLLVSGLFALLIRTELAQPGEAFLSERTYNQFFTMHGSGMIYLVVTPLALALGLYFVPLQIGAAEVAAPRVALAGFWSVLSGGVMMFGGFLTDQGAGRAGWTAYYPLSGDQKTPGIGMDMWILGVILAVLGAFLVAACILATVVRHRAPGMTMLRLPVFSWTMVVTCLLVVASFPVLIAAMVLLEWDRQISYVFDSAGGPAAFQNLFWFYGHPVVYVVFFPFMGIVAEIVATFSRRRFFGYRVFVFAVLAFAGLSMSVWAHHMFATGQVVNEYFSLTSHALIIPAGIEYFDLTATMIGGAILLRTPMLFALAFIFQFLIGGLTGVIVGSPPLDYQLHDSFYVVGHFHYTAFAGSVFALFAAIYYWFPKVTGVKLREGLGKAHWAVMVIATNATFFPMFILGWKGMQRRIVDYPADAGFSDLNLIATIGAFGIAVSILIFLVNLFVSLRKREPAGDDPWEGQTLEWATTSPPPRHNFTGALPPIRTYAPLQDLREQAEDRANGRRGARAAAPSPRGAG